jgi:anti-sigma B factor antagonist
LVAETQVLELDLSELTFLDSSGIGAFVALWKALAVTDGRLLLVNVPDHAHRVLTVTNLDTVFMDDDPALEPDL